MCPISHRKQDASTEPWKKDLCVLLNALTTTTKSTLCNCNFANGSNLFLCATAVSVYENQSKKDASDKMEERKKPKSG
jgi:hypothetical protein